MIGQRGRNRISYLAQSLIDRATEMPRSRKALKDGAISDGHSKMSIRCRKIARFFWVPGYTIRPNTYRFPDFWSFDPTLPVTFRALVRRCHGDVSGALEVVRTTAEEVEERFPLCWVKLRMEEIRLLRTTDEASATNLAQEVSMRTEQLGLTHQSTRIRALA